ncbi:MAG: molybdate ABC transporter substrate-binding protein [Fimbriimonadaceae bacterium]|nr:molybdate ABC transporter substrate-binding protein [Fimbriimonadaceae bacterium]
MTGRRLVVTGSLAVLAGCARPELPAPAAVAPVTLQVFAAASLREVVPALSAAYSQAEPGVTLLANYAGSQDLVAQVQAGASADVFLSANRDHPQKLADAGLVAPPVVFALNQVAIAATPRNQRVRSYRDLLQPGTRLVICAEEVPAGKYAGQWLAKLPSAEAATLRERVVSAEASVDGVLHKVRLGEADAGLAYRTDVRRGGLRDVPLPPGTAISASYAASTVTAAPHAAEAAAFLTWLRGPAAGQVLRDAGFELPAP